MTGRFQLASSMLLLGAATPAFAQSGSGSPPGTVILFMTGVGVGLGLGLLICWLWCKKRKGGDRGDLK